MSERLAKRVLLIGWDAADWKIMQPLMDAGLMPTLNSFVEQGVMGNISTLRPILSPLLWNSIATGKRAEKHGIYGFAEPLADGSGIRPVASTSRRCKAIWNILTQSDMTSNVLGWYASHPAEPIKGVCVSAAYAPHDLKASREDPVPPLSVHPQHLIERLAPLRVFGTDIGPYHLVPFISRLGEIPAEQTQLIGGMQKMLARCASFHAAATELIEREPWDFTAIYYETIDHFCHGFMEFHPPKMQHVSEQEFEWYKDVVTGIYRFHDMMLERLLQLAGDDATVIIVSDHGFYSDHLRPRPSDGETRVGPEGWHRPYGMFAMRGPNILADERVYGASILDITPTILALLGLPVGEDMDGKVLLQCFDRPVVVDRIKSWEDVPGEAGLHPPDLQVDPFEQQQALQQLVELGYLAAPDPGSEASRVKPASIELRYNQAMALNDAGQYLKAIDVLSALYAELPGETRITMSLAQVHIMMGHARQARELLSTVKAVGLLSAQLDLLMGIVEFVDGNREKALEALLRAEQADPRLPLLHVQIGNVYLRQRRWADAERAFQKALAIDGDSAHANHGMGLVCFHRDQYESAVEYALRAVGLQHHFPRAHLAMGMALARLGWFDRAVRALQQAISQSPHLPAAHRLLAVCYGHLGKPELGVVHRRFAQQQVEAARSARAEAAVRQS